jgi:hypothetical protein
MIIHCFSYTKKWVHTSTNFQLLPQRFVLSISYNYKEYYQHIKLLILLRTHQNPKEIECRKFGLEK